VSVPVPHPGRSTGVGGLIAPGGWLASLLLNEQRFPARPPLLFRGIFRSCAWDSRARWQSRPTPSRMPCPETHAKELFETMCGDVLSRQVPRADSASRLLRRPMRIANRSAMARPVRRGFSGARSEPLAATATGDPRLSAHTRGRRTSDHGDAGDDQVLGLAARLSGAHAEVWRR
jgi:hypothetical protein